MRSPPPRKRRRGKPEAVADLLPKVLDDLGLSSTSAALRLLRVWDDAVGPQIAPHCCCDGLRGGVVHAVVRDSAWMQRIQMNKPRILATLNELLGEPLVHDLRLRVGPLLG